MCASSKSYEIDKQALARSFRMLQGYLHPDKFANKSKVCARCDGIYAVLSCAHTDGTNLLIRAVLTDQQGILHTSKAIH